MKRLLPIVVSLLLALSSLVTYYFSGTDQVPPVITQNSQPIHNPNLLVAYNNKQQKLQVKGQGVIVRVLKDDLQGSKHQRLLLRVNPSQTVLIAHNIDLAQRISNPKKGDTIAFYGEYVWNDQGGVIHWTHRDPRGRHVDGWLTYQGNIYQ